MPTPIINPGFILTRLNAAMVRIHVYAGPYNSVQVYENNTLVIESVVTSFNAPIAVNAKVDVLGLTSTESGRNFGYTLSNAHGDKLEFDITKPTPDIKVRVYFDHGLGRIDWGRAIADIDTSSCPTFEGYGGGGFGVTPYGASLGFSGGMAGIKLCFTHRLKSGTYQFAIVPYNAANTFHSPKTVIKTIATRPDELTPYVVSYDAGTDVLILNG